MRSRLEAGNFNAAVCILCSHDRPASDRCHSIDPTGNTRFTPLQVSPDDVKLALRTFTASSLGRPDGLTPQHIADLLDVVFLAMSKKNGRVRPMAVGYVLQRLVEKCTNSHVIEHRSKVVQPKQVGVGVAEGVEAAVHALQCHINLPLPGHAII